MMHGVLINPQPNVVIDLTANSIVGDIGRGRGRDVTGAGRRATTTTTVPSVAEDGAAATSSIAAKEKFKGKKKNCSYHKERNTNYGVKDEKEKVRLEVLAFPNY
jgi:hypothetical protein